MKVVTIPIYHAVNDCIGYYDKEMSSKAADIEKGDKLVLMQCEFNPDEVNAFKYMDAIILYLNGSDVEFVTKKEIEV